MLCSQLRSFMHSDKQIDHGRNKQKDKKKQRKGNRQSEATHRSTVAARLGGADARVCFFFFLSLSVSQVGIDLGRRKGENVSHFRVNKLIVSSILSYAAVFDKVQNEVPHCGKKKKWEEEEGLWGGGLRVGWCCIYTDVVFLSLSVCVCVSLSVTLSLSLPPSFSQSAFSLYCSLIPMKVSY